MSKSVSFSENTSEHNKDSDVGTESEDELAPNGSHRQFNKFELLELVEGIDESISSLSEVNPESADENVSDAGQNETDKKGNPSKQSSSQSSGNSKRKPRKKRGKKASKNVNKDLEDLENEVENLTKAIVLHTSANQQHSDYLRLKLLKVDVRNLIPEAEIKRIFGKGVVKEEKHGRSRQHPGSSVQRSRFVSAVYFEPKFAGGPAGPKMDLDELVNETRRRDLQHTTGHQSKAKIDDTVSTTSTIFNSEEPIYFRFIHDRQYQEAQRFFLQSVHQGHPESIVQNLTTAPLHAESLIQLSHVVRVSEDFKTAAELIERALVVLERGFHPRFNLATATCRLSYKRPENRTFFIAIFKHIGHCHRRGLRRTPFEYSKLLLSLEPENDPLQAIQLLDFFALRSEEYDFVLDFYKKWDKSQKLPNISYSVALAYFMKSRSSKQAKDENNKYLAWADEFLQKALLIFPNFITPLLDACSGEPSDELKKCNYFDYSVYATNYKIVPETVEVMINLYVKRTFSLWKQKPVMIWLERNVELMVNKFKVGELTDERRHIQHWHAFPKVAPKNLLRHIVLCDLDMKIPSSASSSTFLDIDPYPPTDSIISYDSSWKDGNQAAYGEGGSLFSNLGGLFIRSFLPSFSLNDQQQDQNPTQPTTSRSAPQTSSRRPNTGRSGVTNQQGPQITMDDYTLDDEEDVVALADRAPGGRYSEMQSAIRDMANTVTNLLNMQPSNRGGQEPSQDEAGESNRENNADGTGEETRRSDRPGS